MRGAAGKISDKKVIISGVHTERVGDGDKREDCHRQQSPKRGSQVIA